MHHRFWHGAVLVAVATSTGCNLDPLVAKYPALSPILGARATASPFVLNTGNVTGFVYGANGKDQPMPLAFVTTGSISTFAGNPDKTRAVAEANEFDVASDATRASFDVMHDFNDGAGEVATQRILRKSVPAKDPDADDATNDRREYVYLRAGEFFLEGVPEGVANLTTSYGNVTSPAAPVTVYAHQLSTGVNLNLYIPTPVQVDDGRAPKVVEWTGLTPETGVSVTAESKTTSNADGTTDHDVTITYKPDPPDVAITLKAPPGSAGSVIRSVNVTYVFNTPKRQSNNLPPEQIGPINVPIPPVVVSPAQDLAFGPAAIINLPIGSSSLRQVFLPTDPTDQPGLIVANVEFVDDKGFAIQDKTFQNLQVSAVLRAL